MFFFLLMGKRLGSNQGNGPTISPRRVVVSQQKYAVTVQRGAPRATGPKT